MAQLKQNSLQLHSLLLAQAVQANPPSGQAQAAPLLEPVSLQQQFGFTSLSQAVNTFVSVIFYAAALATFLFLFLGALRYLTAGDSEASTHAARRMISNAIVGLLLMALTIVGFHLLAQTIPGLSQFFTFDPFPS